MAQQQSMTAQDLRRAQAELKKTNEQLAEALDVSTSTVVKWRAGNHQVPQTAAMAIELLIQKNNQQ
jgi:DNA-binding transcriptional regulator YiaG